MQRKIPAFLSKLHHEAQTNEEKRKLLDDYDIWRSSLITNSYILSLNEQLDTLIKQDEEKTDWLSWIHLRFTTAHNKGQRTLLRKLIKMLKP